MTLMNVGSLVKMLIISSHPDQERWRCCVFNELSMWLSYTQQVKLLHCSSSLARHLGDWCFMILGARLCLRFCLQSWYQQTLWVEQINQEWSGFEQRSGLYQRVLPDLYPGSCLAFSCVRGRLLVSWKSQELGCACIFILPSSIHCFCVSSKCSRQVSGGSLEPSIHFFIFFWPH